MWLPFRGDSERTIFDPYVSTGPVPSHLQPSIILKAYQSDYGRDAAMLNENELAEQSVKYYYSPFSPRFERSLFCPVETSVSMILRGDGLCEFWNVVSRRWDSFFFWNGRLILRNQEILDRLIFG